jgi:HEPN domain-containing protein
MSPDDRRKALVTAWLTKADGDLQAARACVSDENVPPWIVGFHLQQVAEKTLKGLLVLHEQDPPRIHHLDRLTDLLVEAGGSAPFSRDLAAVLQPHAVEDRYPLLEPAEADREELASLVQPVADGLERAHKAASE